MVIFIIYVARFNLRENIKLLVNKATRCYNVYLIFYLVFPFLRQLIDSDELDNVLTSKVTIYTPSQIKEIMKEIDKDESGAVDYFEVLLVSSWK